MKTKARFIQPMLLLRTEKLPEGSDWLYEIKLDGYRIFTIKNEGEVRLRSDGAGAPGAERDSGD